MTADDSSCCLSRSEASSLCLHSFSGASHASLMERRAGIRAQGFRPSSAGRAPRTVMSGKKPYDHGRQTTSFVASQAGLGTASRRAPRHCRRYGSLRSTCAATSARHRPAVRREDEHALDAKCHEPIGPMIAAHCLALPVAAQTVIDGDSSEVKGRTYRLYGIDAPDDGRSVRTADRQHMRPKPISAS